MEFWPKGLTITIITDGAGRLLPFQQCCYVSAVENMVNRADSVSWGIALLIDWILLINLVTLFFQRPHTARSFLVSNETSERARARDVRRCRFVIYQVE